MVLRAQTVALRWQMDQGVFPVVTMQWAPRVWTPFGHTHPLGANGGAPGVDAALFQKASFLDEADLLSLRELYG